MVFKYSCNGLRLKSVIKEANTDCVLESKGSLSPPKNKQNEQGTKLSTEYCNLQQ